MWCVVYGAREERGVFDIKTIWIGVVGDRILSKFKLIHSWVYLSIKPIDLLFFNLN